MWALPTHGVQEDNMAQMHRSCLSECEEWTEIILKASRYEGTYEMATTYANVA